MTMTLCSYSGDAHEYCNGDVEWMHDPFLAQLYCQYGECECSDMKYHHEAHRWLCDAHATSRADDI